MGGQCTSVGTKFDSPPLWSRFPTRPPLLYHYHSVLFHGLGGRKNRSNPGTHNAENRDKNCCFSQLQNFAYMWIILIDFGAIGVLIRPQRSQEFQSGTGRDFAKSRDPRIFRDGINLIFSSRDWWDPGIFRDGISLKFSSRDFLKLICSKTNKSL